MKAVIRLIYPTFLKYFLLGSILLFIFYFSVLFLVTKDLNYPISQFRALNPWISILIAGFGIQSGLFGLIRKGHMLQLHKKEANVSLGTSSACSGLSMVACCAHHLADVIPVLGIAGLSLFLTEYQKETLIVGVAVNFIGVIYMLWVLTGKEKPKELVSLLFS